MEQNKVLLSRLVNDSTPPRMQSCTPNNGYYVMPDFNHSLTDFSGRESNAEARAWLHSIESVAKLHNWPDNFKLETVRSKLIGPSHNWYVGRTFSNWTSFVDQFTNTFVGHEQCTVDRVKIMSSRVQLKGECVIEYFHHKARLCREILLPFQEAKMQIIEGLYYNDMCNYLVARTHMSEDDLLTDIKSYNNLRNARSSRFRSAETTDSFNKNNGFSFNRRTDVIKNRDTVQRLPPEMKSSVPKDMSNVTCHRCGIKGHIAPACTVKVQRTEKRSCFRCNGHGHLARDCPQNRSSQHPASQMSDHGENVSILERPPQDIVPPYTLSAKIMYPNGNCSSITALLDTGSPVSLLKSMVVSYTSGIKPPPSGLIGINGSMLNIIDEFFADLHHVDLDAPINLNFKVVPDSTIQTDCLLGRNFLAHPRVNISVIDGQFTITFKQTDNVPFNEILSLNFDLNNYSELDIDLNINDKLSNEVITNVKQIYINNYVKHCAQDIDDDPPEMHIQLKTHNSFYFRPRRLSYYEKEKLQIILDDMIKKQIIRPSTSEFSSPIVLVKKKSGDLRLCVDYRELNKHIVKDRYPLPLIDDNLDLLRGKKYFTCFDLKDGFHHIYVAKDSIKYTSFITPLGQFEYLKMPFGLATGPACFSRFIKNIFDEFIRKKEVIVYFDDIMVATETIDEHLDILTRILTTMKNKKLEIRLDKTQFLKSEVIYLGYRVSADGIQPNPKNVAIIDNYPIPSNHKELHSFIGLASYFRRFIPNFALLTQPLYKLLKKNIIYEFGEEQLKSFDIIKSKLNAQPLLSIYDPNAQTELHCDASSQGYGAILLQRQNDNNFHPVFYFSHRTTDVESRYHSYELEMLAIVNAVKRFHIYLQGVHFKIVTDCNSITLTLRKKDINPRIARWALFLQNYSYEIEHRPGSKMQHVDALSRCRHILVLEGCTFNQTLAIRQSTDPEIKNLIKTLEKSEHPLFEMRNGLVYRKHGDRLLFYVPAGMYDQIIRTCHDDMCHIGVNRTIESIKQVYWFPKLTEHVKRYIKNCLKCIIFSPKEGKVEGLLNIIDKDNKPFQTIHIDHYGPLNKTKGRFRYILVVVDAFSKFLNLYPVRSVTTKETCSKLAQYFSYYSKPVKIISDRGSCFRSDAFREFCTQHEIKHIMTAVGSPQSNGQVERYNRSLTVMLSKLMHEHSQNWNENLNKIQFAVNNTINRSINNTPSKLLFGMNQVGNTNDYVKIYLETLNENDNDREFETTRQNAFDITRQNQLKNKAYYDIKHKQANTYSLGDYVMVRNVDTTPNTCKKLIPKFKGPYKILKILPNDRYVVADIEGYQVTQIPLNTVIAARDIKPWVTFKKND